jgi:hypothetical protein
MRIVQEDLWLFESLVDALASLNRAARDPLGAPLKQIDVLDVAQGAAAAALQQPPATLASTTSDQALLDGRYVDQDSQPLKADAKQPFAEFKQIFVYMKVVMDQRRLPELMTALANAPLAVETRRVSVQLLPERSASDEASAGGDGSNEVDGSAIDSLSRAATTPWDAAVEIGGVVYLYNPPDPKKLGTGALKSPANRSFRFPAPISDRVDQAKPLPDE